MSARNGKIAKLPLQIRDELNTRLFKGEPANRLVDWLNAQPAVIGILQTCFEGRPISEQNISEWKQGGYFEWLAIHEPLEGSSPSGGSIHSTAGMTAERLLTVLTARHAEMLELMDIAHDELFVRRLNALERLTRSAVAVRKCELQAVRCDLERERLELLREKHRGGQPASATADRPENATDSSPVSEPPDDVLASPQSFESPESDSQVALPNNLPASGGLGDSEGWTSRPAGDAAAHGQTTPESALS
jgi:hypothetical protein